MRVSIVIASHNEGEALSKTIESCIETSGDLDCEIVVADDASTDRLRRSVEGEDEQRAGRSDRDVLFAGDRKGHGARFDRSAGLKLPERLSAAGTPLPPNARAIARTRRSDECCAR